MASEQLEVGDYVRWDKTDKQAATWSKHYGDDLMKVIRVYYDNSWPLVNLIYAQDGKYVAVSEDEPGGFFMRRFTKDVFLSAASQANRKELNGNTKTSEG